MGNVNNCLSNAFENEEISVKPQQNIVTDKSLRGAKSKDLQSRYYYFNKQKLEIIDEEDNPESNIFADKKPKDRTQRSIVSTIREECSLMPTPKEIKVIENKFINKLNNDYKNNSNNINADKNNNINNNINTNINNNQNMMMIDNVYFNYTRKSNPKQENNEMYRYNKDNNSIINSIDNKNDFKEVAVSSSNNNMESNKMMNSEEESSNLIVLEYNRPETPKVNNNINLNNINGYNNNDGYYQNQNDHIINNIDNNESNNNNINYMKEHNKNELISNENKLGNFNNLMRKINSNYSVEESANIKEANKDDSGPKDNVNLANNNKYSTNTVKNEFTDTIKNLKINNTPYIKPKLNSNYNEKSPVDNEMNNYTYINKRKVIQNQAIEKSNEQGDNYIYFNSRNKIPNKPNSFQINKKKTSEEQNSNFNQNNLVILNNSRYDKIVSQNKYKTLNYKNNNINQNEPIKFISNSRKLSSEPNQALIETQRQFADKPEEIPQDINNPIHYNKTAINIDNTKIYDSPILNNNRRNTDINNINDINNEIINPNYIPSKNQDFLESKNEAIIINNINNNENKMSPNERIRYQSAISDNIREENLKDENDDILRRSASFGEDGNEINNIQQELNSPIEQNMQEEQKRENVEYEMEQKYDDSEPNEQNLIKQPMSKNNYDYLLIQQKEQIKMNPEYEQTQEAHDEEKIINELQRKVIAQSDAPKDKDSESDISPKMHEQEPLTSEVKQYFQKNLLPMSIDRVNFQKKEYIKDNNNDTNANANLYQNGISKTHSKINNNINENEVNEDYENENNFNNENNSQGNQFFSIPLTTSKYPEENNQFIFNKQSYNNNELNDENHTNNINNLNANNNNAIENENENAINNIENENNNSDNFYSYNDDDNENNLNNKYNNNNSIKECKEFEDFSPDSWRRFYPKDERFFKFPQQDIISNKLISTNTDSINEEIYQGDINKKGEKHGFGKYISPMVKRIGMWRSDKFTGWGREIRETGDIYEGRFVNGKLNGKGIYKDKKNKTTYVGDFLNSKFNGKGELYTENYHYQGDFNNNQMSGNGKIEIYNQGEYEGTFKDGQFDGNGMLKWKDGRYYIGEVSKGEMNGYGEETFSDGTIYKGNFVNGKKQGHGKVITPEGEIIEGEFVNGQITNKKK